MLIYKMLGTYRVTYYLNLTDIYGQEYGVLFRWLGWQVGLTYGTGSSVGRGRPSVDREEGPLAGRRGRRLLLAVVDGLVVPEAVQAGVNPSAYVAHWLARGAHVNVLNVPFEPGERRQALVTGVASVIFLGGAGATWSQHKQFSPIEASNALLMHSPDRSLSQSTATPRDECLRVRRSSISTQLAAAYFRFS